MDFSGSIRPTRVSVDLGALRHNLGVVRKLCGVKVCAVVKANGYGHGLVAMARALSSAGVDWLAVALVEEGVVLREAGISTPILVMAGALSGGFSDVVAHRLTPAIFTPGHLEGLAKAAGSQAAFHLKIDTGMARLGLQPPEMAGFLQALERYPHLSMQGAMTHLANADLGDQETNQHQFELFRSALAQVAKKPPLVHVTNSAGTLSFAEAYGDMVRPGLLLYGLSPLGSDRGLGLRPIMRWLTRPVHVKTVPAGTHVSYGGRFTTTRVSRIATLPVGYADGYPRALGGQAQVLARGQRAPIIGTICMDLCMADVTDIPGVTEGDDVTLMGQDGEQQISAYELARWANTIPYEILCSVGRRVPRLYVNEAP